MFGWSAVDIPMLAALPVLLVFSGFFSGSETALFGLTEPERMTLRRHGIVGRAAEALLAEPRMLLITILVGNMTVNVLYFVVTSVLLMKSDAGVLGGTVLALGFLVTIILLGEVTPKLIANSQRTAFAGVVSAPLLTIHRIIGPLRIALDGLVVAPLSRLTSPGATPPRLDEQELSALLDLSSRHGVIDADEGRLLREVISLGQRKVRDVMTPRVRIAAVPLHATPSQVRDVVDRTRRTRLVVHGDNLDEILGLLPSKRYLLAPPRDRAALLAMLEPVHYVPETARLDQLLDHFRLTHTHLAVAVDEYGGTAGIVAVADVAEELVGDLAGGEEWGHAPPMLIGHARWRVSGSANVHAWAEAFGQRLIGSQMATLGGLIFSRLGRIPRVGDVVELGNVRLEVERMERAQVASVIVTLGHEPPGSGAAP